MIISKDRAQIQKRNGFLPAAAPAAAAAAAAAAAIADE